MAGTVVISFWPCSYCINAWQNLGRVQVGNLAAQSDHSRMASPQVNETQVIAEMRDLWPRGTLLQHYADDGGDNRYCNINNHANVESGLVIHLFRVSELMVLNYAG